MKIIFDSKEQFEAMFHSICPSSIGLPDIPAEDCGSISCDKCWENKIECEIKGESINLTKEQVITYADAVYELVKEECEGMDSIYEDYIVKLVGNCGLAALKRANLIETCGVINCRQLYVLLGERSDGK